MTEYDALQDDRIRSIEMVLPVVIKVLELYHPRCLDGMRESLWKRFRDLESATQLPGNAGGATRLSVGMALELLGEQPSL